MQTITIQAENSTIDKILSFIKEKKLDINLVSKNDDEFLELSPEDEAKFRDTLDRYYKGELNFISFEESKAKSREFLKSLGADIWKSS